MFCHITENWRGRPLVSREVAVNLIGHTTTKSGLTDGASLADSDPAVGPKTGFGAKITGNLGDLSLSAAGDVVLVGATGDEAASTDYELCAGLAFALTDTTTMDADYIYSTDKDVASDVEDTAGIIENLSLALSWGLYDLSNGNPDNEDKGHNDKLDMMVGANLGYGFEALGGKLTPSIDVKYNRLDSDKAVVDTDRGDPAGRARHEVGVRLGIRSGQRRHRRPARLDQGFLLIPISRSL